VLTLALCHVVLATDSRLSQMHVSRVLREALEKTRGMAGDADE
jgi:hypothetical protein